MTPQPSPLSYYATSLPVPDAENKVCPQKKGCIDLQAVFNRQKKVQTHIETIIGLPDVKKKLYDWNDRQAVYWMRKRAGINYARFLPEILVVSGAGHQIDGIKSVAEFCYQAGLMNTNKVMSYNVNSFVQYYVQEAYKDMEDAFRNYPERILDFYGFDELIANPNPAVADWYDWVDIIMNKLFSLIDDYNLKCPVVLSMSTKSHTYLKQHYKRFQTFKIENLVCHRLNAKEMNQITVNRFKERGYILSPKSIELMHHLFETVLNDKTCLKIKEPTIRWYVMEAVLQRQEQRLLNIHDNVHTCRKIKSITATDIPRNAVIAGKNILFY